MKNCPLSAIKFCLSSFLAIVMCHSFIFYHSYFGILLSRYIVLLSAQSIHEKNALYNRKNAGMRSHQTITQTKSMKSLLLNFSWYTAKHENFFVCFVKSIAISPPSPILYFRSSLTSSNSFVLWNVDSDHPYRSVCWAIKS